MILPGSVFILWNSDSFITKIFQVVNTFIKWTALLSKVVSGFSCNETDIRYQNESIYSPSGAAALWQPETRFAILQILKKSVLRKSMNLKKD